MTISEQSRSICFSYRVHGHGMSEFGFALGRHGTVGTDVSDGVTQGVNDLVILTGPAEARVANEGECSEGIAHQGTVHTHGCDPLGSREF
ncbi:hypothetical protein D3C86_1996500 [compost metagenome]